MKTYRIEAATKEQFNSLINDYLEIDFSLFSSGYFISKLEKGDDFIIIEWGPCK